MTSPGCDYDVAIVGGSIAGAGTATILLRQRPELRILIDQDGAQSEVGCVKGRGIAAGPCTDHRDVITGFRHGYLA